LAEKLQNMAKTLLPTIYFNITAIAIPYYILHSALALHTYKLYISNDTSAFSNALLNSTTIHKYGHYMP